MTNELKRDFLRQHGLDIEITVVANIKDNTSYHSGKYRYLVSQWDNDGLLVKNYYSDNQYESYRDAEEDAIALAYDILNEKNPYPTYVD